MPDVYALYEDAAIHTLDSSVCRIDIYAYIGVGFCVARTVWLGNAKALKRGTSDTYRLPRLFFVYT